MVESKLEQFTGKMGDLLAMEREAELEETAAILSKYSFKVWFNYFLTIFSFVGTREAKSGNHKVIHKTRFDGSLRTSATTFEPRDE